MSDLPENPFVERFPIGSEFTYLGLRMCVIMHWKYIGTSWFFDRIPHLTCEYVDGQGIIQRAEFGESMFHKLSKENS